MHFPSRVFLKKMFFNSIYLTGDAKSLLGSQLMSLLMWLSGDTVNKLINHYQNSCKIKFLLPDCFSKTAKYSLKCETMRIKSLFFFLSASQNVMNKGPTTICLRPLRPENAVLKIFVTEVLRNHTVSWLLNQWRVFLTVLRGNSSALPTLELWTPTGQQQWSVLAAGMSSVENLNIIRKLI